MTKICQCDRCGDRAKQVMMRAAYGVPLVVVARSVLHTREGPFAFEVVDKNRVPIPDVPILCERCFEGECNRVLNSNRKATFDEFVDFIRRRAAQ